ncbi:MAG: glycosyltransferase [Burkholderiaceae bacterium]
MFGLRIDDTFAIEMNLGIADPHPGYIRPKAYVALYHGIDAFRCKQQYEAGITTDESPYGFHHAKQYGFDIIFAQDSARHFQGRVASFITRLFGFDLLHAWTNRRRVAEADVIWTMTEGEAFAVAFLFALRILPQKPIICNVVWLLNHWNVTLWYKERLYRYLIKYFSVMTVHSERCLAVARQEFPKLRSELMYFGINSDLLAPHPLRTVIPGQPLNVVSLGSDKTRDWETLLAAFGNDARFRLTVVCWRLSESDIAKYDNVIILRLSNSADFLACYHAADIAVVPMIENIFSGITSALDAASVGVPIIASRTGGVPTYFSEDEVYFVPVGDHLAMREAAASSTAAERLAKAERAHHRFLDRDYSSRRLARRYCDLSRSLLPGFGASNRLPHEAASDEVRQALETGDVPCRSPDLLHGPTPVAEKR